MWFLVLGLLLSAPLALAEDDGGIEISKLGDIYPHLPPEGAKNWDPQPLVDAVRGSGLTFTPDDVYELIDKEVHADVITMVANMAALYYDPNTMRPLSHQQADARQGQPQANTDLNAGNFVLLFEFFNDVKNEIAVAEERLGPNPPKKANESQSVYERRTRAWLEKRVKMVGPFEGRAEKMTFTVTLPATVQERDGCQRSVATVPLTDIDFELFRTGMGVKALQNVMDVKSTNTEVVRFTVEGERRFEALARCGTSSTKFAATLTRTWEGQWSGSGGF